MFRRLFLTYYYVFFKSYSDSKYPRDNSVAWESAVVQICLTSLFLSITLMLGIEMVFNFILDFKGLFIVVFCLTATALASYYLLFKIYKVDKNNPDLAKLGLSLSNNTKLYVWGFYIINIGVAFSLMAVKFQF